MTLSRESQYWESKPCGHFLMPGARLAIVQSETKMLGGNACRVS